MIYHSKPLNEQIIDRLGGKPYIAEYLGISKGAVYLWFYKKPQGSGGKIPAMQAIRIYRLAREKGIDCKIEDILGEVK